MFQLFFLKERVPAHGSSETSRNFKRPILWESCAFSFLKKEYQRIVQGKLQKIDKLCDLNATYSEFFLFEVYQKNLKLFHDFYVLIFISNYM